MVLAPIAGLVREQPGIARGRHGLRVRRQPAADLGVERIDSAGVDAGQNVPRPRRGVRQLGDLQR